MAGGPSSPPSDPDSQLRNQLRTLFAYAEDCSARVSLIQSILKKHQEHALPSDLPKDLILEAKVRAAKKLRTSSIVSIKAASSSVVEPLLVVSSTDSAPLQDDGRSLGDSTVLRSATSRVEEVSGCIGSNNAIRDSRQPFPDLKEDMHLNEHALPSDLPHDLIHGPLSAGSDPLQPGDSYIGDSSNDLRSATLRRENCILSANVVGMVAKKFTDPKDKIQFQTDEIPAKSNRWSSLFKSSVASSRELEHCTHPSADPEVHVEFEEDDTSAAKLHWGNALVGYFIGNAPSFFAIKFSLEKAWRISDLEIVSMSEGFYLFKFNNYDAGQVILDNGPWFVHGHPLVLRRWTEDIEMNRQSFETIPVWVRLPNLNFCFRTNAALSKIASVIGRPICMDHATAAGTRYAFARVCIEVGIETELPAEIRMKYKGKTIVQKIEYAWKPNPCQTCKTFDHGDKGCPQKISAKPKKVWVPKKSAGRATPTDPAGIPIASSTDPITGTDVHGEWTVVKDKHPRGKSSSPKVKNNNASGKAISHKGDVSDSVHTPAILNQFSSLSSLDELPGASLEDLAATSSSLPLNNSAPIPGMKVGNSTVESHRFLSVSNLDGDSNVPESEIFATTALVLQGNEASSSHFISNDQQKSLFSIHQLDKSLLSRVPNAGARQKSKSAGVIKKTPKE